MLLVFPEDHWLPATARLQPESLDHLNNHLLSAGGSESAILLARLNLLRTIRHSADTSSSSLSASLDLEGLVRAGLSHAQPEIRVAALAAICRHPARLPSRQETDQLIEFVEQSVAEDDSRFRQGVESAVGGLLMRYRDSLGHLLRRLSGGDTGAVPAELEQGLVFLDRLQRSLVANLRPGGNYQRFVQ